MLDLQRTTNFKLNSVVAAFSRLLHDALMPTYQIEIINEHFDSSADLEAPDVIAAWQKAMSSTITIAADQVSHGNPFFGAEVKLSEGGKQIGRYVVSVGATPLKD